MKLFNLVSSKLVDAQARELAREFQRLFFGHAAEVELDKAGRFLLPENLRGYAGLTRDVMITGVDDHIEIWDLATWRARQPGATSELEKLADQMFSGDVNFEAP